MKRTVAAIVIVGALLAGCATPAAGPAARATEGTIAPPATAAPPTEVPTATPTDTPPSTPTATDTPEPTDTPAPTYTPTPRQSPTPFSWVPPEGSIFWEWGTGLRPGTYGVWVNNLELVTVDGCRCYTCPGENHNHLYNSTWVFVGAGEGTKTFDFPGEFSDVIIAWRNGEQWAFDALVGHIAGGGTAGYGYTVDGRFAASYLDGGAFGFDTVVQYEHQHLPVPEPCGVIGQGSDGNYALTGYQGQAIRGGILFRMLRLPWDELLQAYRTTPNTCIGDFHYTLAGITIHVKPASELGPADTICP